VCDPRAPVIDSRRRPWNQLGRVASAAHLRALAGRKGISVERAFMRGCWRLVDAGGRMLIGPAGGTGFTPVEARRFLLSLPVTFDDLHAAWREHRASYLALPGDRNGYRLLAPWGDEWRVMFWLDERGRAMARDEWAKGTPIAGGGLPAT
jgi:hypothetical protein